MYSGDINDGNMSGGKPLWATGVELFTQISTWIVLPIVLALVVGKKLDQHYGTEPWIFIGLAGFGFLVTLAGIVSIVRKYVRNLKREEENKKNGGK